MERLEASKILFPPRYLDHRFAISPQDPMFADHVAVAVAAYVSRGMGEVSPLFSMSALPESHPCAGKRAIPLEALAGRPASRLSKGLGLFP
jgi:hypothetical protein